MRCDSGDPVTTPVDTVASLMESFGSSTNSKGFKVLPDNIRVIQGDGLNVDTFRDVADFPDEEAKRMLAFVAATAAESGLTDYRVVVNVGPGAGQTVFHLHWHILGGRPMGETL